MRKRVDILDVRVHDLRHTFASISLENGVPMENIREILNHKSITTTQRYTHSTRSALIKAMNGVSGTLTPLD